MPKKRGGKQWRKELRRARSFVEKEFGRGSASVIVTKKPATYERARRKETRRAKLAYRPYSRERYREMPGAAISLGRKGRKQLIFLEKSPSSPYMVHELMHAAYSRIRKRKGKRKFLLVSETLAYSKVLDWVKLNYSSQFELFLTEFRYHYFHPRYLGSRPIRDFMRMSSAARALAYRIHQAFPDNASARMRLRQQLAKRGFTNFNQIEKWLAEHEKKA